MTRQRQSLLHGALLAALLLLGSVPALADLTIKVQKGGEAPYLYAYTGSGDGATKHTGNWPGTQFTEKDSEGYWTMTFEGVNTVNIIFNNGNSGTGNQTNDILDVPGVGGVAKFMYDGKASALAIMPECNYQAGKVAYLICPSTWDGTNLYCQIKHSSYEEQHQMIKVGTDGAGFDIYADFNFAGWNDTPQYIRFFDHSGHTCDYTGYTMGGYYSIAANTASCQAVVHALNAASGYTDPNFRAALASQLDIAENSAFSPSSITYLNLSGKQISSLAGIGNFHYLQTLLAARNNLSTVDLGNNPALEVLDLSGNSGLHGFTSNYANNSNQYINLAVGLNIKELYLADCTIGSFKAIKDHYYVSSLERLDLSGNTNMGGWSTGIAAQTRLKYLNVTNNAYGSDALKLTTLTQLDTLIADNNPSLKNISTIGNATQLRYVSLKNCGLTNSISFGNNTALEYIDISDNSGTAKNFTVSNNPNLKVFKAANAAIKEDGLTWASDCPSLDTLIVSGNSAMKQLTTLHHATGLKYLDMSGGDLYLQNMPTFVGSNFPELTYIDFSNDKIEASKTLDGFSALQTLKIGGNTLLPLVDVNNCPALETLDVSGNTALTTIGLTNQGYDNSSTWPTIMAGNCSHLTTLDVSHNNYTAVPATLPFDCTSLYMNSNRLTGIAVPTGSPVEFLYAQANSFAAAMELTAENAGSLKGLDLGNNGITSFKAEGTALSALMVGDNPQLTTLELHGNDNLTVTTAGTTMSDGSGLYLLGNTALETIDLSNSSFTGIGQNGSLAGLSAVKTLNGSHNRFTLFSNGTKIPATSNYHYTDPETGQQKTANLPSVDPHTTLPNLDDLTGLEWLDMSYNQIDSIHLYKQVGLKYLDLQHNGYDRGTDTRTENPNQQQVYRKGLMKFDAHNLTALEYLNVSDCRIQETAIDRISETTPIDGAKLSGGYVWIKHCVNLKEFYADNNGMRSFGIKDNKALLKASARYMYGQSPEMMKGSINIHDTGVEGGSNLEYFDVSHSMFDSIGVSVATKLKVLKVEDNPIHYLYLNKNKALEEVYASDCTLAARHDLTTPSADGCASTPISGLLQVRAEGLPALRVLDLNGNTELKNLYCENDPILPEITGLPSCTDLRVLHAYNDAALGEGIERFDVDANTALTTLWVSNCSLPGELRVSQCAQMDTLRCDTNRLTKLDVSPLAGIHWLDCFDNVGILELVPGTSTGMTHLDLHNCSVIDLALAGNTALKYFDCDNNKVRELTFAGATGIETIHANSNNLFQLNLAGTHLSLKDLQFEHNHINGIDLTGCVSGALTAEHIKDADNGRTITANVSQFYSNNDNPELMYLYYFQLDAVSANNDGGKYLNYETCNEDEEEDATTRTYGRNKTAGTHGKTLEEDGVDLSKIQWTQKVDGTRSHRSRADYGELDPGTIIGDIAVLDNEAGVYSPNGSGTETYQYDNGISLSEFYLNWTANGGIITEVTDITADSLSVTGGQGCITVTSPQAIAVTVYDLAGRTVAQRDIAAGQTVIDGLQPGIYIVAGQKVVVN